MSKKEKLREITITEVEGTFESMFKHFKKSNKNYNFDGLSTLRNLLSNEKAKILHTIKKSKPESIYSLAKILKRDFKAVSSDLSTLEKFGFIDFISQATGKRERLKPIISVDTINIKIKI